MFWGLCVCVSVLWDLVALHPGFMVFMHGPWYGTTYHLIGHHNDDIVAIGRRLQITGRLRVSKWVHTGMGVFLYECKADRKRCMYVRVWRC